MSYYMKKTFLNRENPMLVAMIQKQTAQECIAEAINAVYDGADALDRKSVV